MLLESNVPYRGTPSTFLQDTEYTQKTFVLTLHHLSSLHCWQVSTPGSASRITRVSASYGIKSTPRISTSATLKSWECLVCSILMHFSQLLLYLSFTEGNGGLGGLFLKCTEKISQEIRPHMTLRTCWGQNGLSGITQEARRQKRELK